MEQNLTSFKNHAGAWQLLLYGSNFRRLVPIANLWLLQPPIHRSVAIALAYNYNVYL